MINSNYVSLWQRDGRSELANESSREAAEESLEFKAAEPTTAQKRTQRQLHNKRSTEAHATDYKREDNE